MKFLRKTLNTTVCVAVLLSIVTSAALFFVSYKAHPSSVLTVQNSSSVTNDNAEIKLPIIMYHSLLKDPVKKSKYIVSPKLFEDDLKYLKKNGYTTVFMKDVIDYVTSNGTLPKKPIVITFDDGYYNNYYYGQKILEKYKAKAVLSIIGKMTDDFTEVADNNPSYAHITWDDISNMHISGLWEIQNHSYNCHSYTDRNGICQLGGESYEDYKNFIYFDLSKLQDNIAYVTGVTPNTFTYPFGAFSENTDKILKEIGFKSTLSCTEGVSTIKKGDPNCLYRLKRHLRPPDESPDEFFVFLKD